MKLMLGTREVMLFLFILVLLFGGCASSLPIIETMETEKDRDKIFSKYFTHKKEIHFGCTEYWEDRAAQQLTAESLKKVEDSLKNYCSSQGGVVVSGNDVFKKYSTDTIKNYYVPENLNSQDYFSKKCLDSMTVVYSARNYCSKNGDILFTFASSVGYHPYVINYRDEKILQKRITTMEKENALLSKKFQDDVNQHSQLIKNKHIFINETIEAAKQSKNGKYYFYPQIEYIKYDKTTKQTIIKLKTFNDKKSFPIRENTLSHTDKFTKKLLNRVIESFVLVPIYNKSIATDMLHSDGSSTLDRIVFYDKEGGDYSVYIESIKPGYDNRKLNRSCHLLSRPDGYWNRRGNIYRQVENEERMLEQIFKNNESDIYGYKNVECYKDYIFEAKFEKIIVIDNNTKEVKYISYVK